MPKTKWDGYQRFCPLARGLDIIGERWTLVIAHNLLAGPTRYSDLKADLPGIGSNVLTDRLRKLEAAGVAERVLGEVGAGVRYRLTERGMALAPVMAEIRRWGADELTSPADHGSVFDMTYALPPDLHLSETYEWRIDDMAVTLTIDDKTLTQHAGHGDKPALIVNTTTDFVRRWSAGETNWDEGRRTGEVTSIGPEDAWDRMLVATNYPGRPVGLADKLLASQ